MGYNSVVLVLNDCLGDIEKDKDFGNKISGAVSALHNNNQIDIHSGCCVNAATAISCQHADITQIIAVGGNCASVLGNVYGSRNHHKEEGQIAILKQLADKFGYRLAKKPKKTSKK